MYGKIIINLFLVLFVILLQLGFISGLPLYLSSLNLILIILVFILEIKNFKMSYLWAFMAGFLMDLYYFNAPGNYFFSLLIAVFFMNFLLENFFTNRSLYSFLALTFFGHLIFKFSWYIYNFSFSLISKSNFTYTFNFLFLKNELISLGLNWLAVVMGFYIVNFIGSNFKPVFLMRKKK
jgi:rod shape-determining protein MreD